MKKKGKFRKHLGIWIIRKLPIMRIQFGDILMRSWGCTVRGDVRKLHRW